MTDKCFCVDAHSGKLLTERMLGNVDCNDASIYLTTTMATTTVKVWKILLESALFVTTKNDIPKSSV